MPASPIPVNSSAPPETGPRPRITVIGTGYLGATHAICMASLGLRVTGIDIDAAKINSLGCGQLPFFEPGLEELLGKALATGRLDFSTDFAAAAGADIHFLCIGTPQAPASPAADLTFIYAAIRQLAPHLTRKCLIAGKSTVPIGTAQRLTALVQATAPAGALAELAWNPEFLREGHAVEDTLHPDRLVFGTPSDWASERLAACYAPMIKGGTPVILTDLATAELVKVAANSFLATKISYINAMAEICEATGADVSHLALALSYDNRIGGRFLKPGLGFGGGCLPKDIRAFAHRAKELGVGQAVGFLREVDAINQRRRQRTVDLITEMAFGDLTGVNITVLGAAFKPDSDDVRDAPALDVARMLHQSGARVTVYDPKAMDNARKTYPELGYAQTLETAVTGAEIVALLTEWDEFRDADPEVLGELVQLRNIVDGRHALNAGAYRAAGWDYRALGTPNPTKSPSSPPPSRRGIQTGRTHSLEPAPQA
ncbi:UDP-glucose dehydrogenase family protein [Arthrobacter sp. MMS18-M83]|uniref:UDP-glucose dehydrogenase family protein n=1 Tax=Arthrobacter sp. MMS18-M83 TaxID=2996261 RepID=UPI00227A9A97|nr:UDP-glucose/GDP-mannose dehydrogenase family protein [Arthrobacter sp. MMS18-M83]WAH97263.1 UDP-glucose/GDP-mannose dehydrogenase family protein [Arthrobacter sp. MMS18-M83]